MNKIQSKEIQSVTKDVKAIDSPQTRIDPITADTISFEMVKGDKFKSFQSLNSSEMVKWTDYFMPEGWLNPKLYSAYTIYDRTLNPEIKIKTIWTFADDWSKIHLITHSSDSILIDIKNIGENMGYLIEQTDSYDTYLENDSKLIFLNDSIFKIIKTVTNTKYFYNDSKRDSIWVHESDSLLVINKNGIINNKL